MKYDHNNMQNGFIHCHRKLACQWCILVGVFAQPLSKVAPNLFLPILECLIVSNMYKEDDDEFPFRSKEDHAACVSLIKVLNFMRLEDINNGKVFEQIFTKCFLNHHCCLTFFRYY